MGTGSGFTAICTLSLSVSGALTTTYDTVGCGRAAPDTLRWSLTSRDAGSGTLTLRLPSALPLDTVGAFSLASLEVQSGSGTPWIAPANACAIAITRSECKPTSSQPMRRIVSGRAACSQPATMGAAGSLNVAPFNFLVAFEP